jgi:hypothetical protein
MAAYALFVSYRLPVYGLDVSLLLALKALGYFKGLFERPDLKELSLYYKTLI